MRLKYRRCFWLRQKSDLRNTATLNRESKNLFDNTQGRGRRINIFGVWEPGLHFDYALMVGTITAPTYVQLMEWQATKAQQHFDATGQITVIVQDNASVHRSQSAQQQVERWQKQGLFLFFLPPGEPTDESN